MAGILVRSFEVCVRCGEVSILHQDCSNFQLPHRPAQLTISINDPYDDKAGASSEEKLVIDLD